MTKWFPRPFIKCQPPTVGSRWHYGNFALGILVNSHPRFVEVVLCLVVVEILFRFKGEDRAR